MTKIFKLWYCRKSTESDEKQIQSIESQLTWLKWVLGAEFETITIFQENKSAKAPYVRKEFQNLLNEIEKINKKVKWEKEIIIYSWWLDRLSRNPVDSGILQYMLQIWQIEKIVCSDRVFTQVDSWIMMWLFNALNNQYILDLQKNTKRWVRDKANKGWCIQRAPNWYINNKLTKEVEVDEKLKPIIKEIFDLRDKWLTLQEIVRFCKQKGYKNRKWWNFAKTTIEEMLKNPFYIWFQKNEWILKKANHTVFIDIDIWNRVNGIKKWFTRKSIELFPLKWIIKDWETKKALVWVQKFKILKTTWEKKSYIYYALHNSHKNWISISQEQIIKFFDEIIYLYEISKDIRPIISEIIKKDFSKLFEENKEKMKSINSQLIESRKKVNRIFELVCAGTISDEKYKEENNKLSLEILNYENELKKLSKKFNQINEESFLFVELLENLSIKRKTWGSYEKLNFIKILAVELFLNEKKELILQENKLFNLIKNINLPTLG